MPARRKTILIPSGRSGNHLHIIITDSCKKGKHLILPISSIKEDRFYDKTCVIKADEMTHPFIIKDSFVYYENMDVRFNSDIVRRVDSNYFQEKEEISEDIFTRICNGILESPHIQPWARKQYLDWPN